MIFKLQENYFDLDKLEMVSKILDTGANAYYFRFSINGFTWDTDAFKTKKETEKIRNNLINQWNLHKKGEL